jgi:nitrile hydratase subunit beta
MGGMARVNDLGGMQGFGPVPLEGGEDPEPFHADWEARVFALSRVLIGELSLFTTDEFRDAIERMPPADYLAASYYERWLVALETVLRERGLLPDG